MKFKSLVKDHSIILKNTSKDFKKKLIKQYSLVERNYKILKYTKDGFIIKLKNIYNQKENINYGDFYIYIDYHIKDRYIVFGGRYKVKNNILHPNIYQYPIDKTYKHSNLCLGEWSRICYKLLCEGEILSFTDNIIDFLQNATITNHKGPALHEVLNIRSCFVCGCICSNKLCLKCLGYYDEIKRIN